MATAKITTKSGAVITIEGTDREVSSVLAELYAVHGELRPSNQQNLTRRLAGRQKPSGPSDLVLGLKARGFFDQPRTLGDIARALQDDGYLIPTTTLSGVALSLLRRGELHRKKTNGQWSYGK